MGLTFEKVWAMFQETDRKMQETDRRIREADEKFEKERRKTEQVIRDTNKQLGKLGRKFGSVVEHMVVPNLVEKFNSLGFTFTKCSSNVFIEDRVKKLAAEVDILLENGNSAVAVEVKSQPKNDDVDGHEERMATLRLYADARQDARKFYGAVAGAIIPNNVKEYALKKGFFVIKQSGDTMKIDVPKDFQPRAW
jgi:hypothetical protein